MDIIIAGCGPSLLQGAPAKSRAILIACNRAIELVPADVWVWVDRAHHERSRRHPNAKRARSVAGSDASTLLAATREAIALSPRRIVFAACDGWGDRDRYHSWDGAALSAEGLAAHRAHLEQIATAIGALRAAHPGIEFLDATPANRHLGLPYIPLEEVAMVKPVEAAPDERVPTGYGRLVSVTSHGPNEAVLWFEDSSGTIRAVRMDCDRKNGLALKMTGQAQVIRQ